MSSSLPGVSRNRSGSLHSGMSSHRGRTGEMGDFTMAPPTMPRYFEPSAATASMFLYAQGTSVVCCHHDTLAIERRFARHSHEVQLLAVDNLSEQGAGRCVVSYDAGQNAIVWDLMTGDEIARFASYEHLTAAAWMRSGNVAFGNSQGNIILFEPATSEHISARTIDQITVTALAPSGDCRTFAIGYQNGQCLVATLQPRFTILHNLTTSRMPSPVVTLCWHASSSRQKSDMLASQTQDGDLKVWSVAKAYSSNDPAKVVRALKRNDVNRPGANWMAWSKNGRIIQYTDSQTISWDVRTKHVTHDMIPTLEHVRGLSVYGPGATLFTLGPNNTVQQFDLNAPAIMVANVQHPANLLPPSPPVSIEEQAEKATTIASESEITFNPSDVGLSESDNEYQEQMHHDGRYRSNRDERYETGSMISSQSGISSVSGAAPRDRYQRSVRSRASENTYISAGESTRRGAYKHSDMYSQASFSTTSTRSRRQPSRLRHEIDNHQQQPAEDSRVDDLFRFTRSRLSDIPYKTPAAMDNGRLTNDHLRRQMLSIIFGWHKEVEDLIADEMGRHPTNSSSRIMLGKWLGIIDQDIMNASAESMTSADWMLLALSGVSNHQGPQHKIGRAYVTTLLEKGDVHAAATILIGMGDHNDAIEIYVSHKRYMEALILTCLFFPSVWERQAAIIKRWGAWAVQHDQQDLAIRCFACAGQESTEPWASPSAAQLTFQNHVHSSIGEILSPPLSPPSLNRGPQRQIGKTSALKLITSFGDQAGKAKFFSDGDGGQTPLAAGATPIAESAIDHDGDPTTAFIRPSNLSGFNTPTSVKSFASSAFGGRNPLPSIGETHGENATPLAERPHEEFENQSVGMTVPRAATASPMMVRGRGGAPQQAQDALPTFRMERQKSTRGNGPRDRMPAGLKLQLETLDDPEEADRVSPTSVASSARYHWPSRRRGPASVSSVTSASTSRSVRTTATGGRHLESYIHSLDAATSHKKKSRSRHASRDRSHARGDAQTDDRGRTPVQSNYPAKRSPTSPVPMSPEELVTLGSSKYNDGADPLGHARKASKSRASSRGTSRRPSPERRPSAQDSRGRSRGPDVIAVLSPTSPQPMSALPKLDDTEDEEDYARAVEAQERFRQRHNRSAAQNDRSHSRNRRVGSESGRSFRGGSRGGSLENVGDLRSVREERQRKKEQAARELEERRKELSRNSRAGPIPHPSEITPLPFRLAAVEMTSSGTPNSPPRSRTADPLRNPYGRGNVGTPSMGLPATPKAMRLVMDSDGGREAPAVPSIPASYRQSTQSTQSTQSNRASPDKGLQESPKAAPQGLTLLAPTVYQPPRAPISRCMSAPIPDQPSNRNQRSSGQSRSGLGRNASIRSKNGMDLGHIQENVASSNNLPPRRGSYDDQIPPPPPAAPMLKELQHLAMPPPPPPAPLPHVAQVPPPPPPPPMMPPTQAGSALASGMIEIVMDDDEPTPAPQQAPVPPPVPAPITVPSTEITVPILPPPAPPSLKGHSRGRSTTDNSIAGRFSKATERLRSASRSRKDSGFRAQRSPEFAPAPYESIQPPVGYGQQGMRSPPPGPINPQYLPTGLNKSDLI